MRGLNGKVAVITGGGAGIGKATAKRLAEEGARVALLDKSEADLSKTLAELETFRFDDHSQDASLMPATQPDADRASSPYDAIGLHGNVASTEDCEAIVQQALDRWGRLDILIANAGIRVNGSLLEATEEEWERVLAVNLKGIANACVAAAKAMKQTGNGGAMVLVSSANAIVGRADMGIYDAAKAGVLSLARTLAVDLAKDGIRVNSVCPGYTITDYHIRRAEAQGRTAAELRQAQPGLFKRPAEPEEMASALVFLASDDASYITATNLMVDAGGHAT
jgi:NAD(P)-dependent dehydrogenase (short-subunit alcohol dehydrogenase family)